MNPRIAAAGGTVLLAIAACSIIHQSSDYFDPSGTLVTLATVPGAQDLVLTDSGVYFRTGDSIFRVPKVGGDVILIYAGTNVAALASDGRGRVVWTDTSGVFHWDEGKTDAATMDWDAAAETVGASSDRIAFTSVVKEDDAGAGLRRRIWVIGGGVTHFAEVATSSPIRITIRESGSLYLTFPNIVREGEVGDDAALRFDDGGLSTCILAKLTQAYPPDEILVDVDTNPDGTLRMIVPSAGVLRHSTNNSCCFGPADAGVPTCDQLQTAPSGDSHTLALRHGMVFRVNGPVIDTFPYKALANKEGVADATTIRGGFTDKPHFLAVDDSHAFFIANDSVIQRLSLVAP